VQAIILDPINTENLLVPLPKFSADSREDP